MSNTTAIAASIERARKVLQYEQRSNHQDRLVQGGLELFASRWAEDFSALRREAGLDMRPLHRLMEHLEGYRQQDPLQRSTNVRAALSILDEMEHASAPASSNGSTGPVASRSTRIEEHERRAEHHATRPAPIRQQAPAAPASLATARSPLPAAPEPAAEPVPEQKTQPDLKKAAAKPGEEQARAENPIRLDREMSTGHTSLAVLSADVTAVPGVGASMAAKLRGLGIRTIRDLLFYFPRQHRDYSKLTKIAEIPFQEVTTTIGLIWEVETKRTNKGLARTIASIGDETGRMNVTWFNQGYLQKQLLAAKGEWLVVTGVKQRFGNKVEFAVRSHELPERGDSLNTGRLVPVYPLTDGLPAKSLRKYTKWTVDRYAHVIPDHMPPWLRSAGRLMPLPEAVMQIHYP
ncbi:MAG TPA: hypothetical protein VF458_11220, partial [Ktedonobacteraceae bacterium]